MSHISTGAGAGAGTTTTRDGSATAAARAAGAGAVIEAGAALPTRTAETQQHEQYIEALQAAYATNPYNEIKICGIMIDLLQCKTLHFQNIIADCILSDKFTVEKTNHLLDQIGYKGTDDKQYESQLSFYICIANQANAEELRNALSKRALIFLHTALTEGRNISPEGYSKTLFLLTTTTILKLDEKAGAAFQAIEAALPKIVENASDQEKQMLNLLFFILYSSGNTHTKKPDYALALKYLPNPERLTKSSSPPQALTRIYNELADHYCTLSRSESEQNTDLFNLLQAIDIYLDKLGHSYLKKPYNTKPGPAGASADGSATAAARAAGADTKMAALKAIADIPMHPNHAKAAYEYAQYLQQQDPDNLEAANEYYYKSAQAGNIEASIAILIQGYRYVYIHPGQTTQILDGISKCWTKLQQQAKAHTDTLGIYKDLENQLFAIILPTSPDDTIAKHLTNLMDEVSEAISQLEDRPQAQMQHKLRLQQALQAAYAVEPYDETKIREIFLQLVTPSDYAQSRDIIISSWMPALTLPQLRNFAKVTQDTIPLTKDPEVRKNIICLLPHIYTEGITYAEREKNWADVQFYIETLLTHSADQYTELFTTLDAMHYTLTFLNALWKSRNDNIIALPKIAAALVVIEENAPKLLERETDDNYKAMFSIIHLQLYSLGKLYEETKEGDICKTAPNYNNARELLQQCEADKHLRSTLLPLYRSLIEKYARLTTSERKKSSDLLRLLQAIDKKLDQLGESRCKQHYRTEAGRKKFLRECEASRSRQAARSLLGASEENGAAAAPTKQNKKERIAEIQTLLAQMRGATATAAATTAPPADNERRIAENQALLAKKAADQDSAQRSPAPALTPAQKKRARRKAAAERKAEGKEEVVGPAPKHTHSGAGAGAAAAGASRTARAHTPPAEFSIPLKTPVDFGPPSATAAVNFTTPAQDFVELTRKAEAGDPDDMLRYALYLSQLSHRPDAEKWQQIQDRTEGREWLEKAADKAHKDAMCIHIMASYISYTSHPSDGPLPAYMDKANSYLEKLIETESLIHSSNLLTQIFTLTDPQQKQNVTDYLCTKLTQMVKETKNMLVIKMLGCWYDTDPYLSPDIHYFICKIYTPMVLAHDANTDLLMTFFTLFERRQLKENLTTITSAQMIEAIEACQAKEPEDGRLNFYLALLYLIPTDRDPAKALIALKKCDATKIAENKEHIEPLYRLYRPLTFLYSGTGTVTKKNAPLLPVLDYIRLNILAHCQLPADSTSDVENHVYWTRPGRKAMAEFALKNEAAHAKADAAANPKVAAARKAAPKAQPKRRTNNSATAAAQAVRPTQPAQRADIQAVAPKATGTGKGSIAAIAPTVRLPKVFQTRVSKAHDFAAKKLRELVTGNTDTPAAHITNYSETAHAFFSTSGRIKTEDAQTVIENNFGEKAWDVYKHVVTIKIPGYKFVIIAHVGHKGRDKKFLHIDTKSLLAKATDPQNAGAGAGRD